MLELRRTDLCINKVSSHLEEVGGEAVDSGLALLTDIIGNAFADEAVALASMTLRPEAQAIANALDIEKLSFEICVRIGLVQVRIWEMNHNVIRYELNELSPTIELDIEEEMAKAISDILKKGRALTQTTRGELVGQFFQNCKRFRAKKTFGAWQNNSCERKADANERAADFQMAKLNTKQNSTAQ